MHGLGGSGGEGSYSPDYPWSADDDLQDFITKNAKIDPRLFNTLFRGLFWKGALEAGLAAKKMNKFEDVRVVCTKGDALSGHGKWFAINTIQSIVMSGDDVTLIPVGKSIGGFDVLEVVEYLTGRYSSRSWRKKCGTLTVPSAVLIDPDNLFLSEPVPARVVPMAIGDVTVVRQNNPNFKSNFLPKGLCGRVMARKNGTLSGISDFCYPIPPVKFPETDPHLPNREVTHWTIDEHMVLHGHPKVGTLGTIVGRYLDRL